MVRRTDAVVVADLFQANVSDIDNPMNAKTSSCHRWSYLTSIGN